MDASVGDDADVTAYIADVTAFFADGTEQARVPWRLDSVRQRTVYGELTKQMIFYVTFFT